MKISVTNISSEEVNKRLNRFSVDLSDALDGYMRADSFGEISNIIFAIVSVDDDIEENLKYCRNSNKVGSFVDPGTSQREKYLSFAIPYSPAKIIGANEMTLPKDLCEAIARKIDLPELKIPKTFDYDRFSERIKLALAIFGNADFVEVAGGE